MYEILICPVKKLYELALEGDMCEVSAIAVSSYEVDVNKLRGLQSVITFDFDDIIDENDDRAFSSMDAYKIAEFVKSLPECTDTLFVCCDSGESRSTAMAAAIMRYNELDEMKIWKNPHYHPNPLVYHKLCNAFSIKITDMELRGRVCLNEKAFENAFKK